MHKKLSKREHQVLELICLGITVAQMAEAMGITESTVKSYVERLYAKLNAHNKASAIMAGVARGYVE